LSYASIRERYVDQERALPADLECRLRSDPRPAARAILAAIDRRRRDGRREGQRLRQILRYERALWEQGVVHVAGVDEAGMSPLAGPVAAAAVIFPPGFRLPGVDDSKKLDAKTRERLAPLIQEGALACAVGFVEPEEIDRINIYWAGILAMKRALAQLSPTPAHVLVDGRKIQAVSIPQERIYKGDQKSLSIAAASILAKTARDARMVAYAEEFPEYGFAVHKGYPVRAHRDALARFGACPIHRRSFVPVRKALGLPPICPWPTAEERASSPAFEELARPIPSEPRVTANAAARS
jgi:ribonuclease HII